MRSLLPKAGLLTVLAALLGWTGGTDAQAGKVPTVKEVMAKVNKGPNSLCPTLGKAIKADTPNWEEIQKETKAFLTFAEALTRNDPPRGDRASWDKLTKAYLQNVKELDDAVQKKDKAAATAAHGKVAHSASCNNCHKAHRG